MDHCTVMEVGCTEQKVVVACLIVAPAALEGENV